MSRRIGFTDIREWQSLTNGARRTLGSIDANFSIDFFMTTVSDIMQLTEMVEELNATARRYREVARDDVDRMRIACERMQEADREIRAAWGSGR